MEVLDRKKLASPLVQPLGPCQGLALGAVPVAAGIISDALKTAAIAFFEMTAQCGRAASLQGVQHPFLRGGENAGMVTAEGVAVRTYDVSDFQCGSQVMAVSAARWNF